MLESRVDDIAVAGADELEEPYLAVRFGGSIATSEGDPKILKPKEAQYAVYLSPTVQSGLPKQALRGVTIVSGEPQSFYTRVKRQVLKVLVREMGV